MALLNKELLMGDLADAVRQHYTALPKNMFGKLPIRNKTVDVRSGKN